MVTRILLSAAVVAMAVGFTILAEDKPATPLPKSGPAAPSDIELVERLVASRKDYQQTLEKLRQHYKTVGDIERAGWAEDELKQFHRLMKYAYRLEIDVPVASLQAKHNIPEANDLFREAMKYKDKGFGTEYVDNQRRAELLFQRLLDKYPESDKIGDTAYQLGDIYEKYRPTPHYHRAATYFERSFQWNKTANTDSRLRAARIYDRYLTNREKAKELYKDILSHDTDSRRIEEAKKRLEELR
jgi:TolA-binding protein